MLIKTSEMAGAALDWAVAKCEGSWILSTDSFTPNHRLGRMNFSTDWSQGGPIIEREGIGIDRDDQGVWFASYGLSAETAWGSTGPTPLIASMRCYVASKLGDEVSIPEGLL